MNKSNDKLPCDYCGKMTTGRVDTCDGGTAICCRECKKELRHEDDCTCIDCQKDFFPSRYS